MDLPPCIETAGKLSTKVYFIIKGQIHIMSKDGMYQYGILNEGSYFGDISTLLNQPNYFSYFYNPI
jgi:signal-transduction protein with cAMP-binding, CBS, and nucleotidyltransferase domain